MEPLSQERRAEGLRLAVQARQKRARIKDDLREGRLDHVEVLDLAKDRTSEVGKIVATMKVMDFLRTLPWVSYNRAGTIMSQVGLKHVDKRIRGLGTKQFTTLRAIVDKRTNQVRKNSHNGSVKKGEGV